MAVALAHSSAAARSDAPFEGFATDSTSLDPCAVAPVEQLRFVVTAGLGRLFPVQWHQAGETVSLAEPNVVGAGCPSFHVEFGVGLREGPALAGRARISVAFVGMARFARTPRSSEALRDASLCIRQVDGVQLTMKDAPGWLTGTSMRSRLGDALVRQPCFDITSLVFVFLRRGGTLVASP